MLAKKPKRNSDVGFLTEVADVRRTSSLKAPVMELIGHASEIMTCKFSPNGYNVASGSFDKELFVWNVYGNCENFCVFKGHRGSIIDLKWLPSGNYIISTGSDKTLILWDIESLTMIRKFKGHRLIVNSCDVLNEQQFLTAADDSNVILWDKRCKSYVELIKHKHPVTSVLSFQTNCVVSGGLDNKIYYWDRRKVGSPSNVAVGHHSMITSLSKDHKDTMVLSNANDNVIKLWDGLGNHLEDYVGSVNNYEKNLLKTSWSADDSLVASGSADNISVIWDVCSKTIVFKLSGHKGCVNQVDFHPKEPILLSCSSDKKIYMGELSYI